MLRHCFSTHCFQVCAIIVTMMNSMATAHFYIVCIPGSTGDENLFEHNSEFCAGQEEAVTALMESCGSHAVGVELAIVHEEETAEEAADAEESVKEPVDGDVDDGDSYLGGNQRYLRLLAAKRYYQPIGRKSRGTDRKDPCHNLARPPTDGQRMACCIMGKGRYSFCGQFEHSRKKRGTMRRDLVEDDEAEEEYGEGLDADEVVHARVPELEAECTFTIQEYARTTNCFGNPDETKCLGFFVSNQ